MLPVNRDTSGVPEEEAEPGLLETVFCGKVMDLRFPQNRRDERAVQVRSVVGDINTGLSVWLLLLRQGIVNFWPEQEAYKEGYKRVKFSV